MKSSKLVLLGGLALAACAAPLDVVVIVDQSEVRVWQELPAVARGLRPGDRMAVVTAAAALKVETPLTGDVQAVDDALARAVKPDRVSHVPRVYEALNDAAKLFDHEPARERAVLLLTFNREKPSRSSISAITATYRKAGIRLFAVVLPASGPRQSHGARLPSTESPFPRRPPVIIQDPRPRTAPRSGPAKAERHTVDEIAAGTRGRVIRPGEDFDWTRVLDDVR